MAASSYKTGFSVFSYEWLAAVVLIILAIFFLPFYLRSKIYTPPEFLEKRFDARSRTYFSALNVLTNIGVDTAATLYAGALVVQLIFPSVTLWQYLQSALSYIVPPIVALFFIGVFWKRANAHGEMAGIIAGIVSAAFFLFFWWLEMDAGHSFFSFKNALPEFDGWSRLVILEVPWPNYKKY